MFRGFAAFVQIAECIEALLPFIQERLLHELSMVLAGAPFVEPSTVLNAPSSVPGSSAASARALAQQALYVHGWWCGGNPRLMLCCCCCERGVCLSPVPFCSQHCVWWCCRVWHRRYRVGSWRCVAKRRFEGAATGPAHPGDVQLPRHPAAAFR